MQYSKKMSRDDQQEFCIQIAYENREIIRKLAYKDKDGSEHSILGYIPEGSRTNKDTRDFIKHADVFFPNALNELRGKAKDLIKEKNRFKRPHNIVFLPCSSFEVVTEYGDNSNIIAVLNFANAYNVGGGYKKGSLAQEENLCRCSTLYPSLDSYEAKKAYRYNYDYKSIYGPDTIIHSPNVSIFRSDYDYSFTDHPYDVAVFSMAAPNLGKLLEEEIPSQAELKKVYLRRIRNLLVLASDIGYEEIVLGAFGCGAFRNSPKLMAQCFNQVLVKEGYKNLFNNVIFAIPYDDPDERVENEKQKIFQEYIEFTPDDEIEVEDPRPWESRLDETTEESDDDSFESQIATIRTYTLPMPEISVMRNQKEDNNESFIVHGIFPDNRPFLAMKWKFDDGEHSSIGVDFLIPSEDLKLRTPEQIFGDSLPFTTQSEVTIGGVDTESSDPYDLDDNDNACDPDTRYSVIDYFKRMGAVSFDGCKYENGYPKYVTDDNGESTILCKFLLDEDGENFGQCPIQFPAFTLDNKKEKKTGFEFVDSDE